MALTSDLEDILTSGVSVGSQALYPVFLYHLDVILIEALYPVLIKAVWCGGGVEVNGEGSEAVLRGNRIYDGKLSGVLILNGASATLENNTITDNDWAGVDIDDHATATLTGNTIKGNGQCKIERTEEVLATWPEVMITLYRSLDGFSGVRALDHSTITMPPGSNTIEGNGKVGSDGVQVMVDETSKAK